jgi:hypothetical protein
MRVLEVFTLKERAGVKGFWPDPMGHGRQAAAETLIHAGWSRCKGDDVVGRSGRLCAHVMGKGAAG